jgi:hypothetical protein
MTPMSRTSRTPRRSAAVLTLAGALAALGTARPATLAAQEKLVGSSTFSTGLFYDNWSLPTAVGAASTGGTSMVTGASQLTIPVGLVIPIVPGWTMDTYVAYTKGQVRLAIPDASGQTSYQLNGLTDARVRVVGSLVGDNVLLTAGVSAPSGRTSLNAGQLDAFSVLSAPGLRFRSPVLGSGGGATLGLIFAQSVADWSLALGTSYETRGSYAPAEALTVGASPNDLQPGNALHLSLAGERVMGALRHTLSVSADIFRPGELRNAASVDGTTALALGPSVAATYQVDATVGMLETSSFVVARRRAEYKFGGERVMGSDRTELDGGTQVIRALSPSTALRLGLDARYLNASFGLDPVADAASQSVNFSTAGIKAVGVTVGVRSSHAGLTVEPFVRAQLASLDFMTTTRRATGLSGGATLTTRF